jgi:hypothetical protein
VQAIRLPRGDRMQLEPAARIRSGMSEALARWVRTNIIPVIEPSEARPSACR